VRSPFNARASVAAAEQHHRWASPVGDACSRAQSSTGSQSA
jgi:hypothetical protein